MNARTETDVLVVGAGPSGMAAAVMAGSLNLRTVIVEAGAVGGKLHVIGALENVPGNWSTGPQLAEALMHCASAFPRPAGPAPERKAGHPLALGRGTVRG
ncbi:hypothetical protein SMICM17S_06276 [Streptomyces microflavus]